MPISPLAALRDPDTNEVLRNFDGRMRRNYRVSCSQCATYLDTENPRTPEALSTLNTRLDATFRWHSGGRRWVSRCRECERAARNAAPRAARRSATAQDVINETRNFGVELECRFPRHVTHTTIRHALGMNRLNEWRVTGDGSIRGHGYEIVSPVLSGDDGIEQVRRACRVLRELGASVDRSCGTHVHHEITDLSKEAVNRFAKAWASNQHLIDGLVAPSRRGAVNPTYCASFTLADAERVCEIDDLRRFARDRYKTLNFSSYGRYGTVEVRQHQGTLDAEKITSWVRFAQAFIATAAERDVRRNENVVSFLGAFRNKLDATAKTFLLGRAVEFAAVPVTS